MLEMVAPPRTPIPGGAGGVKRSDPERRKLRAKAKRKGCLKARLEKSHPKYLRRLARELQKHSVNGFYQNGSRFSSAHFGTKDKTLRCYSPVHGWQIFAGTEMFSDPYGQEICASRAA